MADHAARMNSKNHSNFLQLPYQLPYQAQVARCLVAQCLVAHQVLQAELVDPRDVLEKPVLHAHADEWS